MVLDLLDDVSCKSGLDIADGNEHLVFLHTTAKAKGLDLVHERLLITREAVYYLTVFADA